MWNNGISKKWFLIAIFICITIPIFSLIVFYNSGGLNIYKSFLGDIDSWCVLEMLEMLVLLLFGCLIMWLLGGNILGFFIAYDTDIWCFEHYPICTLMVCFYLFCSMLRCRNMKVNVFMALVPLYNPIALLFKKPRAQNNKNETLTVTAPFEV